MKPRILVVDDEPLNLSIITEILEKDGYDTLIAINGRSAVEKATQHIPDLIIMDWDMPEMNGIEAVKKLKENNETAGIPVVIVSGVMVTSQNLRTAFEAGAIDFVRKPIEKIELLARMRSMLLLSKYHKENLESKNRELVALSMKLIRNNEYNESLIKTINELKEKYKGNKEVNVDLAKLHYEVSMKIKTDSWSQFESYFNNVHPQYLNNLLTKHPDLSPAELRLCIYLSLNLNTKEIASIVYQKPNSVRIARTRLRKKLNLSSDDNLVTYLISMH